MEFTAKQVADLIRGQVEGNPEAVVRDVSKIEEGRPGTLSFFSNPKYEHYVYSTQASVIIVDNSFEPKQPVAATLIRVPDAREALAELLQMYEQMQPQKVGIEEPSYISKSATVGEKVYVGAFAYIGDGAVIGKGAKIYPQAYIGDGVKIGDGTTVYSGVKIYKGCKVGKNCVLHSGVVIGADGFGFQPDEKGVYHKVPQVGIVEIEDDVEIGANTCIDRATMGKTVIGHGTKLDNLIQIAHNVTVGSDTVMASQSGVAGSSKLGSNCIVAGQVGIAGHIEVANRTTIAAQSGVQGSVRKEGQTLFGSPAFDYMAWTRSYVVFKNLPKLDKELSRLSKQIPNG
ncbi:MAG: UDP-3-O-(3-hydroxymyristoyl)glucosamine N-acyltransferase [Bacteroidales bacterium]|nr:UDP-3-O-(3-hydroxymyristoyl)glucosamine N-acyltransferase [Bacteroidales bacterium]